jgi:glycosyltransferase involved in cell wall biosynthesis
MSGLTINARFLGQPLSGVQRYAGELLDAFDRILTANPFLHQRIGPVTAYSPACAAVRPTRWQRIRHRPLPGGNGHLWEQVALARASRGTLLLSLCGSGPIVKRDQIIVIHDANIFTLPGAFAPGYRLFHKAMRPRLARNAHTVATVSHAAAATLAPFLGVDPGRFAVIPNSAAHILTVVTDPATLTAFGLDRGGYFLAVGNQSPNKNMARLIAAHASVDTLPLVVAGGTAPGLATDLPMPSRRTRHLGRVSDGQLRALYEGAAAFVWPSLSEGFGIPPLEAMALGTPVLSSRTPAMPEVLGDAALYFDPTSPPDIAAALRRFSVITPAAREAMITGGFARAAGYSWESSAERLVDLVLNFRQQADWQPGRAATPLAQP